MPLPDEIRGLVNRIVARLEEARGFDVHPRQARRHFASARAEGRPVGIVNLATKRPVLAKIWQVAPRDT